MAFDAGTVIQEPPTHGKVLVTTSVGEFDIELVSVRAARAAPTGRARRTHSIQWSKECPKACRNFVQLCMEVAAHAWARGSGQSITASAACHIHRATMTTRSSSAS
jgi:hypothetical protein